ncbi:MAG: hypothetical protein CML99_07025 [Rhodobiaceae bacterium]|nr:hypothetical protein [Rhodobiaceae bacterium]
MTGETASMSRIAIMQPYFVPYAGYFRLFAETDLFVIYDCVQFPRRGYVHRNRLPDHKGQPQWLTLPLAPADRQATIQTLCFAEDAVSRLATARRKFPLLQNLPDEWEALFATVAGPLVPWLGRSLDLCCRSLQIDCPTIRSSELAIAPQLRGQDRIIAICKALGASSYLNAPGGQNLYAAEAFHKEGIELRFLPSYEGSYWSILFDLLTPPTSARLG